MVRVPAGRFVLAATILLAWVTWPALLVPVLPGVLLLDRFTPWSERRDLISWLGGTLLLSLAYWTAALWLTAIPFVTIGHVFHATIGVSLVVVVLRPARLPSVSRGAIVGLLLLLALYLVPFATRLAFHRGDMTMNTYYAELLVDHDGIPKTHEPLLAIPTFGEYALGFHEIVALVTRYSPLPVYRSALLVGCVAFFAGFVGFFLMLPRRVPPSAAFLAVFAFLFLSHYPHFLMQWGSASTMLSLAFLVPVFPMLARLPELTRVDGVLVGLLCAAGALTHSVPPFGFVLFAPVYVLVMRGMPRRQDLVPLLWIAVAALVLYAGQALRLPDPPESEWIAWARDWNRAQLDAVQPLVAKLFGTNGPTVLNIPLAYVFIFGPLSVALSIVALFLSRDRRHRVLLLLFVAVGLVVLGSKLRPFLPFDYALYPERVLVFIGVPVTVLLADVFSRLSARAHASIVGGLVVMFVIGSIVLARYPSRSYYRLFKDGTIGPAQLVAWNLAGGDYVAYAWDDVNSAFTSDALDAVRWIRDHVPRDEVVDGDDAAGVHLVPVIAGNRILRPHYQRFWYATYMVPWQEAQRPRFYLGVERPAATEEDSLGVWREVFRRGDVAVFERGAIGRPSDATIE